MTWLKATSDIGSPSPPFDQSITTGPSAASMMFNGWKSPCTTPASSTVRWMPAELTRERSEPPRLPLDLPEHRWPVDTLEHERIGLDLEHLGDRHAAGSSLAHDCGLALGVAGLTVAVAAQDGIGSVLEHVTRTAGRQKATRIGRYP